MNKPHIAILFLGVGNLRGGGGAERLYADVFEKHHLVNEPRVRLSLIVDDDSFNHLREINKLCDNKNIYKIDVKKIIFKGIYLAKKIGRWCDDNEVDVIHIPLISPKYLFYLWGAGIIFGRKKPKISIAQVDANLVYGYNDKNNRRGLEQYKSIFLHWIFFNTTHLDGIFTWYKNFSDFSQNIRICGKPLVRSARFCFVDSDRYKPSVKKHKKIVFAARMVESKRPLLFIHAVNNAVKNNPEIFNEWHFDMYGDGVLLHEVEKKIISLGLQEWITVHSGKDLENVFAESSIFVSTQEKENFTSLSMLEAMSSGNAIVAFDVGQTRIFVHEGANGLLAHDSLFESISDVLTDLLSRPNDIIKFSKNSRDIVLNEQCALNFINDIENYWCDVHDAKKNSFY